MNQQNNITSYNFFGIVFFVIILMIIMLSIYFIINKTNLIVKDKDLKEYTYPYPKSFVSNYLDKCPLGCIRGVCKRMENNSECKYDYQCSYCTDRKTGRFFVDFGKRDEILPVYEEQTKLSSNQSSALNREIEENNEYIHDLNEEIEYRNNQ
jgi:hypothetical protein